MIIVAIVKFYEQRLDMSSIRANNLKYGYARISTKGQNVDLQVDALKKAGCHLVHCEVAKGSKENRPEWDKLFNQLQSGDTLVIWKLDRMGRSLTHLTKTINELIKRNVDVISLNDPIDTTTAQGKLMFNMFASLAEFEKDLIRERTMAGLKSARARGRIGGRPKGLSLEAKRKACIAEALYNQKELGVNQISEQLGISKSTLYKYLRYRNVEIVSQQTV